GAMDDTNLMTKVRRMALSTWQGLHLFFKGELAIDLGTANTRIFVPNRGVVINEPSIIALKAKDRRVVAAGQAAKSMIGRVPPSIRVVRPLRGGVIADV